MSRPENSVAPVSDTTIRRRTSARANRLRGTPPRVTSSSITAAHMPSRSASAADSSGCSDTTAVTDPGRIRRPVRASYSSAPTAGDSASTSGSVWSGVSASTVQIRAAATLARITLLAYSVAVRSGIIRNAE